MAKRTTRKTTRRSTARSSEEKKTTEINEAELEKQASTFEEMLGGVTKAIMGWVRKTFATKREVSELRDELHNEITSGQEKFREEFNTRHEEIKTHVEEIRARPQVDSAAAFKKAAESVIKRINEEE